MYTHMKITSTVDIKVLRRILVVMILAHCMIVYPYYDSVLLPMVIRNRWVLPLLGLMDTTICPYITLLPAWTSD